MRARRAGALPGVWRPQAGGPGRHAGAVPHADGGLLGHRPGRAADLSGNPRPAAAYARPCAFRRRRLGRRRAGQPSSRLRLGPTWARISRAGNLLGNLPSVCGRCLPVRARPPPSRPPPRRPPPRPALKLLSLFSSSSLSLIRRALRPQLCRVPKLPGKPWPAARCAVQRARGRRRSGRHQGRP